MAPPNEAYHALFQSFHAARDAYLRLEKRGPEMSDLELARDRDYHELFSAGRLIEYIGGRAAIEGAIDAFFPEDHGRTERARRNLGHWWAGFGTWRTAPPELA